MPYTTKREKRFFSVTVMQIMQGTRNKESLVQASYVCLQAEQLVGSQRNKTAFHFLQLKQNMSQLVKQQNTLCGLKDCWKKSMDRQLKSFYILTMLVL